MIAELIAPVTNSIKTKFCGYKFKILPVLWTFILVLVGYYFDIADDLSQAVYMLVKSVTDFHISDFSYGSFMAALKPCGYRTADFMLLAFVYGFSGKGKEKSYDKGLAYGKKAPGAVDHNNGRNFFSHNIWILWTRNKSGGFCIHAILGK